MVRQSVTGAAPLKGAAQVMNQVIIGPMSVMKGCLPPLEDWLAPYLNDVNLLNDFKKVQVN